LEARRHDDIIRIMPGGMWKKIAAGAIAWLLAGVSAAVLSQTINRSFFGEWFPECPAYELGYCEADYRGTFLVLAEVLISAGGWFLLISRLIKNREALRQKKEMIARVTGKRV